MRKIIQAEDVFQVPAREFSLTPSREGYTLGYSVDGKNWDFWKDDVPPQETLICNHCTPNMYYKCKGNNTNLELLYEDN